MLRTWRYSLDRDEDEIEKQAHAIAENHDLGSVMGAFRPRAGDGVEIKLPALGKKPLTRKELEDQAATTCSRWPR